MASQALWVGSAYVWQAQFSDVQPRVSPYGVQYKVPLQSGGAASASAGPLSH